MDTDIDDPVVLQMLWLAEKGTERVSEALWLDDDPESVEKIRDWFFEIEVDGRTLREWVADED